MQNRRALIKEDRLEMMYRTVFINFNNLDRIFKAEIKITAGESMVLKHQQNLGINSCNRAREVKRNMKNNISAGDFRLGVFW